MRLKGLAVSWQSGWPRWRPRSATERSGETRAIPCLAGSGISGRPRLTTPPERWNIAPKADPTDLVRLPGVHPLVVQLLANRGIVEPSHVASFLDGPNGQAHDAYLLEGMSEAVDRIERAIADREMIAVHGDFDADGVTATAVLVETLESFGAKVTHFIPQREDGYGFNVASLGALVEQGARLVVTVDCGISSAAEVEMAREHGLDVVVTDHHRVTGPLPEAVAVVNPRRPDCRYPYKALAGVGVAFKLAQALLGSQRVVDDRTPREVERSLLDLVAIGTIADVVPLNGENRVLACRGLAELNRTARPGLRELIRTSGHTLGQIDSWDISYVLGPRLNAAGRLGDAVSSYRLLTGGLEEAPELAQTLEAANLYRQQLTEEALSRAREQVRDQLPCAKLLIVASEDYRLGIVGLVAGRLTEEYNRPTVVLGIDGAEARGSARSIAAFDLAAALTTCQEFLTRFGGHARAAGFTVPLDKLGPFRERLLALAEDQLSDRDLSPQLEIDAELSLRTASWRLHREIDKLAPFGHENPSPLFLSRGLRVLDARVVGQTAPGHLRLLLGDGYARWNAIGFGFGELAANLSEVVDIAYHLEADTYRGGESLRLRLKGIRPTLG